MESGELVRCAAGLVKPHLVVAVDALAARSVDRLSSTVQITDRGISPGSGIGNRRRALDEASLGCPVMGVGVPTVVDSSTLVLDALEKAGISFETFSPALTEVLEGGRSFFVSPKDCDEVVTLTSRLLARALDEAFGVGEL
jgi:spore protease